MLREATSLVRTHRAGNALALPAAFRLLDLFGIPAAGGRFVDSVSAAIEAAESLSYPVALKTAAPDILHKTEAGGVALGLADRASVTEAYLRIAAACGPLVQVQPQIGAGVEVLLGMTNDPQFGPMVTVALGGILTELLADAVTFQPPIDASTARACLQRLKEQGYWTAIAGVHPPICQRSPRRSRASACCVPASARCFPPST